MSKKLFEMPLYLEEALENVVLEDSSTEELKKHQLEIEAIIEKRELRYRQFSRIGSEAKELLGDRPELDNIDDYALGHVLINLYLENQAVRID